MRADARLAHTPFLMVANYSAEGQAAARRAGAASYIVKPFNAQSLRLNIASVLGAPYDAITPPSMMSV